VSMVRLRPVWMTNHPPSVLWHCWLGHQTCKNRGPYNLYCVAADIKTMLNQSINPWHNTKKPVYYWTTFASKYAPATGSISRILAFFISQITQFYTLVSRMVICEIC